MPNDVTVHETTPEEGRALFDSVCREELGVSGDQFLTAYEDGILPLEWPHAAVMRVEMLLPFAGYRKGYPHV